MRIYRKIEDKINEKMTPSMIEAIKNSNKKYIMNRFNLLELLIILHWKNTGKFDIGVDRN